MRRRARHPSADMRHRLALALTRLARRLEPVKFDPASFDAQIEWMTSFINEYVQRPER